MSEANPIYRELAQKLIGVEELECMSQIIARLANREQAEILQHLPDPDRDPSAGRSLAVSEIFAAKLKLSKEIIDKHIQELFEKGILFPTKSGPQMARTQMQLHDATLCNSKYDDSLGNKFFDLWATLDGERNRPVPEDLIEGETMFRIVPRWKSIQDVPGVLPYEDIRQILKAQEFLVLAPCGCKRSYRNRECGIPHESCITVGRTAQYNLSRGVGREITYEEALEVIEKYDQYPVINLTVNQKDIGQLVCNCHWCCCIAMSSAQKSRFVAEVDPEKCLGCRTCVSRCQYGAAQMIPHESGERARIDPDICRGCGCCVITCSAQARSMKAVRPPEHIPDVVTIY
ncbi:ATP-binding protein [Chloroflexota bacterium]